MKKLVLYILGVIILLITLLAIAKSYYFDEVDIDDYQVELTKSTVNDSIKFNKYLERDEGRIIYLASNIEEFYFQENSDKKTTLKEYAKTWQTLDDIVKNITLNMDVYGELNDGGTKIYKSKDKTVVVCNTIPGNKDIFIGDYNMSFDSESMCKR